MARLTPTEKAMVEKSAAKGGKTLGKPLTKDESAALLKVVQDLKGTGKPVLGKEAIALWAAKVEFAAANGDAKNLKVLLNPRSAAELSSNKGNIGTVAFWDNNGGCSCGGGGGGPAGW